MSVESASKLLWHTSENRQQQNLLQAENPIPEPAQPAPIMLGWREEMKAAGVCAVVSAALFESSTTQKRHPSVGQEQK